MKKNMIIYQIVVVRILVTFCTQSDLKKNSEIIPQIKIYQSKLWLKLKWKNILPNHHHKGKFVTDHSLSPEHKFWDQICKHLKALAKNKMNEGHGTGCLKAGHRYICLFNLCKKGERTAKRPFFGIFGIAQAWYFALVWKERKYSSYVVYLINIFLHNNVIIRTNTVSIFY